MVKRKPMSAQSNATSKIRYQPPAASVPVGSSMYGGTMDIPGAWQSTAKPTKRAQYQPPAQSIPIASHMRGGTIDIPGSYQSVARPVKQGAMMNNPTFFGIKNQIMDLLRGMGIR